MNWLSKKFIWLWSWLIDSPWKFICSWVDWFKISLCGWIHWTFHVQNHFWNLIIYIFVCQVRFFFKFSSSKIVFKPNFIIFDLKLTWVLILNLWIKNSHTSVFSIQKSSGNWCHWVFGLDKFAESSSKNLI